MRERLVLESLVTTVDSDGTVNVAPMGPHVGRDLSWIELMPFRSSTTFANLQKHPFATVHVTDNALLIARAAIGKVSSEDVAMEQVDQDWHVLKNACRWYAVEVTRWTDDERRPTAHCELRRQESTREFFGFNRAKHAVIEVAILATRIGLLDSSEIDAAVEHNRVLVEKTGGNEEHQAMNLLTDYIRNATAEAKKS